MPDTRASIEINRWIEAQAGFTAEDMRGWYNPRDVLGFDDEHIVPETSSIEATIAYIAAVTGLPLTARDEDVLPALPRP